MMLPQKETGNPLGRQLIRMRWVNTPISKDDVYSISNQLGVSEIIATQLVRKGLIDPKAAKDFINPRLRILDDPFRITNLKIAVKRIEKAIKNGEEVIVFGDYDVDGITSTVFLVSILQHFNLYPHYLVPRRKEEGYGLSQVAIDRALAGSVEATLFIAIDCGTNSQKEIAFLCNQGIDVIIIDHHTTTKPLPEQCIIINPHIYDDEKEPWSNLCSVGLIFKLVHGLIKELRNLGNTLANKIDLKDYLDLVAIGTIADLVPLRDENRILTKAGLNCLKNTNRLGLTALFKISGMKLGDDVSTFDISYRLSPRINASGRLADASLPIKMLLSDDRKLCMDAARTLNNFNEERRAIERSIFLEAEKLVKKYHLDTSGIVLYGNNWHPGVVGIVASRITQKFHRPAIILGTVGDMAKGSGRSIKGINLVEVLKNCQDMLGQWGGHPMAVGVSIHPDQVKNFQKAFHNAVYENMKGIQPEPELEIANWITIESINEHLLNELDMLHPFGQENAEPVFGLRNIVLKSSPKPFGHNHFRFMLDPNKGKRLFGVAWNQGDKMPPRDQPIDLAVKPNWNIWNGRKHMQIALVEWRSTINGE